MNKVDSTVNRHGARYPSLRGKRVFVTGGGSGIGAALVAGFADQGAQVAFVDINPKASAVLAETIGAAGHVVPWWQACDVTDADGLRDAIAAATASIGDFHVLVNNVGFDDRHRLDEVTPEYYDRLVAVNQRAAFFALQAVVPGMRRLGGGAIVNLGSIGWQIKGADYPVYAIAKSATSGLTRGTAKKLGADRIRVNTVSPGWVMTERQRALWLTAEGEAEIDRNQCLPDRLEPHDIAAMVMFLASDDARMCTAQEFVVDGGWR